MVMVKDENRDGEEEVEGKWDKKRADFKVNGHLVKKSLYLLTCSNLQSSKHILGK